MWDVSLLWLRSNDVSDNGHHFCSITIITKNASYCKLFRIWFVSTRKHLKPLPANFDHFNPCRVDLRPFLYNYETVLCRYIDQAMLFLWIVGISFDNIEATFECDLCTNYVVTTRFSVQDVTLIWIIDPWLHTNMIRVSFCIFQLNKSLSVETITKANPFVVPQRPTKSEVLRMFDGVGLFVQKLLHWFMLVRRYFNHILM